MNNIEECLNTIELLKQALEFYANKENYEVNVPRNNVLFAYIEMDKGAQARFALEKIEALENLYKVAENDYVKEVTDNDVLKAVEEFKKSAENFGSKR